MTRWLAGFLKRYVLFTIAVIGLGQAYAWLFAYEDQVKSWTAENRSLLAVILVLAALVYAMYDWLEHKED